MDVPREDYEKRAEATLARRLLIVLVEANIISEYRALDIEFPSWEAIEAAESATMQPD